MSTRNYRDGLCDIPVHKSIISEDNYTIPTIYPPIYPSRKNIKPTCNSILSIKKVNPKENAKNRIEVQRRTKMRLKTWKLFSKTK